MLVIHSFAIRFKITLGLLIQYFREAVSPATLSLCFRNPNAKKR